MKRKRPEEYSTACIEEILESFSRRRYKTLARGQTLFSEEIWKETISKDHTSVKLLGKFSSTTSTVK